MATIARLERKSRRWEQVWQGDAEVTASIVAGRLEAEGIQTRIVGHTAPYRASALNLGAAWGITVPSGKAERARQVLRENDEGHNVIEDEIGESLTRNQGATLQFAILGLVAMAAVVAILLAVGTT